MFGQPTAHSPRLMSRTRLLRSARRPQSARVSCMLRESPTTLRHTLTTSSRSVIARSRGNAGSADEDARGTKPRRSRRRGTKFAQVADGVDIRAGRHALVARIVVWLERLTQMSRTRSCPNRRLVCLALESPPDDVAFEMPPVRHRISPIQVVQLAQQRLSWPGEPLRTGFLTPISRSCTPENTLLLSVR